MQPNTTQWGCDEQSDHYRAGTARRERMSSGRQVEVSTAAGCYGQPMDDVMMVGWHRVEATIATRHGSATIVGHPIDVLERMRRPIILRRIGHVDSLHFSGRAVAAVAGWIR